MSEETFNLEEDLGFVEEPQELVEGSLEVPRDFLDPAEYDLSTQEADPDLVENPLLYEAIEEDVTVTEPLLESATVVLDFTGAVSIRPIEDRPVVGGQEIGEEVLVGEAIEAEAPTPGAAQGLPAETPYDPQSPEYKPLALPPEYYDAMEQLDNLKHVTEFSLELGSENVAGLSLAKLDINDLFGFADSTTEEMRELHNAQVEAYNKALEAEAAAAGAMTDYVVEYAIGDDVTPPTTGWEETVPDRQVGEYIWVRTTLIYGDGQTKQSLPSIWSGADGADGVTTYIWLKYADSPTTGMSDSPEGKAYMGIAYNKLTPIESDNYADYDWSLIKGTDGIDGAPGADGTPTYTWVKYGDDYSGAGMSDSPVGKTHIGFAFNKPTPTESNAPGDYQWSLIQGPRGSDGVQGPPGEDGTPRYTWIKYADTPTSGMSDSPTGKAYMGIAYNKLVITESSNYSDYQWSLIKGADGTDGAPGIPGPPGEDGETTYTWIKYADTATGSGLSDSPTNKKYIGIAYNKPTPTESTSAGDYQWALIQGPQGIPGPPGEDGKSVSIEGSVPTYANLPTGLTAADAGKGWITEDDGHLIVWSGSGWTDVGEIRGPQGVPGPPGENGQPTYTWIKYADTPTSGMSELPTGKTYMGIAHNKLTPDESSNYSDYQWSLIKGADGQDGAPGVQGPPGADGQPTYTWVRYADTATGEGFSDSPNGKKYIGLAFNKTTAVESTNAADYQWSLIQGPKGDPGSQGVPGPPGDDGTTLYTWIKYADTPTSGMNDSPTGKTYMGIAYNKLTPTESSNYSDYQWSLIKGADGVQGPPGADGTPTYTWVKYADTSAGGGMSDSPTNKKYIGLAFNKPTPTESATASEYQWSLIQGPQGNPGTNGVSVTGITIFYRLGTSTPAPPTGTADPAGWSKTQPAYVEGQTLYRTERISYSNNTATWTPVSVDSNYKAIADLSVEFASIRTSANGLNSHVTSTDPAPTTETLNPRTGQPWREGDTWHQWDSTLSRNVVGQWSFHQGVWRAEYVSHQVISSIDVNKLTVTGGADMEVAVVNHLFAQDAFAQNLLARRIVVGDISNYFVDKEFLNPPNGWKKNLLSFQKAGTSSQSGGYQDAQSHWIAVDPGDVIISGYYEERTGTSTGETAMFVQLRNATTKVWGTPTKMANTFGTGSSEQVNHLIVGEQYDMIRPGFFTMSSLPSTTTSRISAVWIKKKVSESNLDPAILQGVHENLEDVTNPLLESVGSMSDSLTTMDRDLRDVFIPAQIEAANQYTTDLTSELTTQLGTTNDNLSQLGEDLEARLTPYEQNVIIDGTGISLSQDGSPFSVVITNNGMYFKQYGTDVAYVTNNKLMITHAEILETLVLGKFEFKPRLNGNLSLVRRSGV